VAEAEAYKRQAMEELKKALSYSDEAIKAYRETIKRYQQAAQNYMEAYRQTGNTVYLRYIENAKTHIAATEERIRSEQRRQHELITKMTSLAGDKTIWFVKDRIVYGEERHRMAEERAKAYARQSIDEAKRGEAAFKAQVDEWLKAASQGWDAFMNTIKSQVEAAMRQAGQLGQSLLNFGNLILIPVLSFFASVFMPPVDVILSQLEELEKASREYARKRVGV
jgi:uncharacterized protein YukE